jgi:hypothetical protein
MATCAGISFSKKTKMKKLLIIVLLTMTLVPLHAQKVAISSNMLMDALMIPNAGAEVVVGERSVVGLHVFGSYHPWGQKVQMLGLQPEYRYFFSGRPMNSFFVGVGTMAVAYDITWSGKVYNGNALGAGLIFGYVLPLSHRVNLDFYSGFGMIAYSHKEYFKGDYYDSDHTTAGFHRPNALGYTLLPTRIGVSITYMLR